MINTKAYWGNIIIENIEDAEREFVDYIEHLAKEAMRRAELELIKIKECGDVLDLPPRKENWSAQESAEDDMLEHMNKVFSYLKEVGILTRGLQVFKDGLLYEALKNTDKLKKRVEIK